MTFSIATANSTKIEYLVFDFSRAFVGRFHSSKSSRIVIEFKGMSGFTFITLKLYHGGALLHEGEEARYVGGLVSEYVDVDVDVDTISYFEIKDYIKELGYSPNYKFSIRPPNSCFLGDIDNDDILLAMCNCLQNGAVLEVYVHMPEEESGATFNKVGTTENKASENIEYNEVGEAAFNGVNVSLNTTSNIPSTSNPTVPNTDPSDSEDSEYSVAPRTIAPPTTSRTPRHEASASGSASRDAPRTTAPPTTSRTPTHEASASVSGAGVSSRAWSGREKGRGLGSAARGSTTQGVDQNTNVAPKETATSRKGKGVGNTTQFKRPRPGLPSSRILAGPKRVLRSNVVTGDVGFKPTSGLRWKGNQVITTRRLQQIRDQSRLSNPNASSSS
ncbi:hypothetical protein KY290_007486 [Solanum tuberosum]|uniref:PB1-like domain-containing protein n=1 Tax=Solanum tuberosum TaxID=4113 RepID=A0ABQ7W665_SOLTU|nr:hypothetical protein KY290_007486 [Solanum tuberosum]